MYTGAVSWPGRLRCLLVAALIGLACQPARAQDVLEATLDNGLRVLLQEDHRSPVASFQIWYRVGSRDERVGLSGLSHYLEHMMFKGTPTYGPRVYSKLVEMVGGQDNAFTSRDVTAYHVTVAADQLELVLELEADRMRHLLLDPREVDSERKVVMEERRTRTEDDPVGGLAELFNAVAFVAHPYRIPTIGFAQDIERLTAADLRTWYDVYYRPNNAIVVAVGDFRAPELLDRIRTRFGGILRGSDPPAVAVVEPEQRGERRVWLRKQAELPVVFAGYLAPNHRSGDAYALEVLSTILSGGRTSRLYRRLVYEERVALEASGDYTRLTLDPDTFTFYVTVLPGRTVEEAERALAAEVDRLRTELVSDEELRRAQNQLEAAYLFGQDSVFNRSAALARHELLGGWRLIEAYLPGIRAVTREDVRRVAERHLVAERRTTAILVPVPPVAAKQ
jgi:zinc protease